MKLWMTHVKLPYNIRHRVTKYYDLIWKKLKGLNDEDLTVELPESL
jgi:uncharacterized protein VirK/YbjX